MLVLQHGQPQRDAEPCSCNQGRIHGLVPARSSALPKAAGPPPPWWRCMTRLKLLFQRLLVFGLGVLTVWLIAFVFFDFADKRLPWMLALAVTYAIAAYVIL